MEYPILQNYDHYIFLHGGTSSRHPIMNSHLSVNATLYRKYNKNLLTYMYVLHYSVLYMQWIILRPSMKGIISRREIVHFY